MLDALSPSPSDRPYISIMSTPQTLVVRTFTDRAEGLSHFVLRAGEAPRLLAFDDALGCPVETALAALEWTGAVGILLDDDMLHAARLTSETAAAVIERKGQKVDGTSTSARGSTRRRWMCSKAPSFSMSRASRRSSSPTAPTRSRTSSVRPPGRARCSRSWAVARPRSGICGAGWVDHPGAGRAASAGGRMVRRQRRRLPFRLLRSRADLPVHRGGPGVVSDTHIGVRCGYTSPHRVDGDGRTQGNGG